MDGFERAASVAHYRTHLAIESHMNDAADRHAKTEANRKKNSR